MKRIAVVLVSLAAVVMSAAPASANTYVDRWTWQRHHRVVAQIKTIVWEESVYDLGTCENAVGPPTTPEVYCTVLRVKNRLSNGFKGSCILRVQVGTFGIGGNPDQTVSDTSYPVTLNLGPKGQLFPVVVASYSQPVAAEGQYPYDFWSDYWVQNCTHKGKTLH